MGRRQPLYSLLTMAIETEIKFRVENAEGLAATLRQAGFREETPRAFESNVLFDTPDRKMRSRTEILRIRSYGGRWVITHKRLPDGRPGEDVHKHRIETETQVADGDVLAEVFKSIGLVEAFRYEKWRSEWSDGQGHCVIDETPIGVFAELEGQAEWIDRTAAKLGVDRSAYITLSYGRLFEQWCAEHNSGAKDLTFDAVTQSSATAS
jgi:adenylate cyclase, class 2